MQTAFLGDVVHYDLADCGLIGNGNMEGANIATTLD